VVVAAADWGRAILGADAERVLNPDSAEARRALESSDVLLTGTSWPPTREIALWKEARRAGIPSVAVLDYWSNYRARFLHGRRPVWPERIAVMDTVAAAQARAEGVPAERLVVTGQPYLEQRWRELEARRWPKADLRHVAYLSQPLSARPGRRRVAFDEFAGLRLLARSLDALNARGEAPWTLLIRPHPKDDRARLAATARRVCRRTTWTLEKSGAPPDATLHAAGMLVGLDTMLLVEAELAGKPVVRLTKSSPLFLARTLLRASRAKASSARGKNQHRGAAARVARLIRLLASGGRS
jgi:hypothetical protein